MIKLLILLVLLLVSCGPGPTRYPTQVIINQCVYQCSQAGYTFDYAIISQDETKDTCVCK